MKRFLLILFMGVSSTAFAQKTEAEVLKTMGRNTKPEKGDAQIVVKSPSNFVEIAKRLMQSGYTVDKLDTTLNYLTTLPRAIPGINGEYYLNIMKIGDQYKFVGMYRFNFTATLAGVSPAKGAYEIARYHKSAGNTETRVFNAVLEASKDAGEIVTIMK